MTTITPGDAILAVLKANTDCSDLVYNGADGIIDVGDLSINWLRDVEAARRSEGSTDILTMVVRDGSEVAGSNRHANVYVGLYDRQQGYAKLKIAQAQVIYAVEHAANVVLDAVQTEKRTPLSMEYAERSGFVTDSTWHLQLVEVRFDVTVYYEETY
jgi:hypothetical protein